MIINIRGTSGSGKSTVVRGLMAKFPVINKMGDSKKPEGYECLNSIHPDGAFTVSSERRALYVVGRYESVCGGCDTIRTPDEIANRIRNYIANAPLRASQFDLVFEGLLISRTFDRYRLLALEFAPQKYVWAFLDTPLEICLERVAQRRAEKGVLKPLNPANTTDTWKRNVHLYTQAKQAGLDARWLDHKNAVETAWSWLNA
jgi:predicted kinase